MALTSFGSGANDSGAPPDRTPIVEAMTEALSSLAETFKNVGVSRAYGPAVKVDGEELIPVALVSFGFGGGGNSDAGSAAVGTGQETAAGGGGGGFVLPLGVYCRNPGGHVTFRPNTIALLAGLAPLVCAVGYTVRGILRARRR
jgi:hypothetical protein